MLRKSKAFFTLVILGALAVAAAQMLSAADVKYDSGGRRDPFIPVKGEDMAGGAGARMASSFVLEGIIYDPPANPVALVGGQMYKVGDSIGTGKIIEIQKNQVIVEINEETKVLWIQGEDEVQKK